MKKNDHPIEKKGKANASRLAEFLSKNGQFLLPMVALIEQCRRACDERIAVAGRATVQAVLELSAPPVAGGPPPPGQRRGGEGLWPGHPLGRVMRSDWKLGGERPRLRKRSGGEPTEGEIPADTALQNEPQGGARRLDIRMRGVSTRQHQAVIPVDSGILQISSDEFP